MRIAQQENSAEKRGRVTWFTQKINITCDIRLALTTEASGTLSNSRRCPTLSTFSSGSQKPRQINGRRGPPCSIWRLSWKLRRRMTWGDQALVNKASSFIFNRGFYTLSYTQRLIGDAKSAIFDPYQKLGFLSCKFIVYKWLR